MSYSTPKLIPKISSNFGCGFEKKFGLYYGINKKFLFAALKIKENFFKISLGIEYN